MCSTTFEAPQPIQTLICIDEMQDKTVNISINAHTKSENTEFGLKKLYYEPERLQVLIKRISKMYKNNNDHFYCV